MNTATAYIASHVVAARESFRNEKGQGALEYIAIVIGLVLLVAAGFQIAGVDIFKQASSFVNRVIGNTSNGAS